VSRAATQRGLVGDLLDRGFGGSAETLLLRALESRPSAPAELERIRALLARLQEQERVATAGGKAPHDIGETR
jgi:hypothetical protein